MSIKVFYDHQTFDAQRYGGISRYFIELIKGLAVINDVEVKHELFYTDNEYASDSDFSTIGRIPFSIRFRGVNRLIDLLKRKNKINSIRALHKKEFDIFHPTYYDSYFLDYIGKKPFVLTVYDMIHELFPENFSVFDQVVVNKRALISKAAMIIAISENTKKDILKFYKNIDENKIKVIHLSHSISDIDAQPRGKYILPDNFILYIGYRAGYKNFSFFVESLVSFLMENNTLHIVCVGGGKFNEEEKKTFAKYHLLEKIHQYSVKDSELPYFYKSARIFVFPSLYEGFGIPILEAFACGCPVILSNTSCFPEIGGDAAVFFDILSKKSLYEAVKSVSNNTELRNELVKRGRARLQYFSWHKTITQTLSLYKSIV